MTELRHDKNCIFCKIIRGEVPSFKIFEDDFVLAFMDVNPLASGHALVIPKYHAKNILETPFEWTGKTFATAGLIACAIEKTLDPDGISIVQANGPGAKQSVFHLHVHVIPRSIDDKFSMNWDIVAGNLVDISRLAKSISANVA